MNDKTKDLIERSELIGLKSPFDAEEIENLVNALHKASETDDCEVVIYITGGCGDQGIYVDVI